MQQCRPAFVCAYVCMYVHLHSVKRAAIRCYFHGMDRMSRLAYGSSFQRVVHVPPEVLEYILGGNWEHLIAYVKLKTHTHIYNFVINAFINLYMILLLLFITLFWDRLCGLVVRVLGYRSGGPGSIPCTTRKKVVGLERGALSLVSTTEELLDRKVAAPV
jgi:hypothetical protein